MMKIRYSISMDDVLAFSQFFNRHSPTVRRSRLVITIGTVAALMAIGAYRGIKEQSWYPPITMLVLCLPLLLLVNWFFWRRLKKTTERLYSERPSKGMLGQHELEIDEEGLTERTDVGEQRTRWEGVERIETTPDHAFIFIGVGMAHVVPRPSVMEGQYDQFVSAAEELWERKNPQQPAQRDD